jgi:hypothetical protein
MRSKVMTDDLEKPRDPTEPIHSRKPFPLKLVLWSLSGAVVMGWLRFTGAILNKALILEFIPPALRLYLILAGLLWGLAGLPALWGAIRRAAWAPRTIWITAAFYPASYWFERLVLWVNPEAQSNHGFMLLLTGIWFLVVFWALRLKASQRYFEIPRSLDEHQEGKPS